MFTRLTSRVALAIALTSALGKTEQRQLVGFGAAVGFSLGMVLFAAMRERIAVADVPVAFQGSAIAMITAGLMSLAFLGFTGLVSI